MKIGKKKSVPFLIHINYKNGVWGLGTRIWDRESGSEGGNLVLGIKTWNPKLGFQTTGGINKFARFLIHINYKLPHGGANGCRPSEEGG